MHQPLRDVPQEVGGVRVDLLGVEADVVGEGDQLAMSSVASSSRPMRASASASQNEQQRKAPSAPRSPSSPL